MEQAVKPLIVSSSPHFHSRYTTENAMRDVCLALVPTTLAGFYFFGLRAVLVLVVCMVAAMAAEYLSRRLMGRKNTLADASAGLTGLLLGLCLPPSIPFWMAALGAICAIVIGKQVFGGLGQNIFNPAHVGRAIMVASFPAAMTSWTPPQNLGVDATTMATPLAVMRSGDWSELPSMMQMFTGQVAGCIGETSALALLVGGAYLMYKKHIDWRIPASYVGTVFVLMSVFGLAKGYGLSYSLIQVVSGGLLIGALFMATDWVTSPITKKGRLVFGLGLGLLTSLIRMFGGLAEGVSYSILLMNIMVPLIDRYTRGRVFGRKNNG